MSQRDYYDILGISRTAGADEIRKAHRKLVRQYHPDRNKAKDAAAKFAEVQEAYDVLSDPEKRGQYDRFGAVPGPGFGGGSSAGAGAGSPWGTGGGGVGMGPGGSTYRWSTSTEGAGPGGFDFGGGRAGGPDIGSVFEQLFGGGGGGGRRRRGGHRGGGGFGGAGGEGGADAVDERGADIQHDLSISFDTAMRGGNEQIRLSAGSQTQTIDVTIPRGIAQGAKLRLRGKGQPGPAGTGDLILTIHIGQHPWYRRDGLDLYMDVPLTLAEAVLGVTVENVPTPKGKVSLKIPPGTSSGRKLRIPGHGIEHAKKDGQKGDFYAVIAIHTDKTPSPEVKEVFEGLKDKLENPRQGPPWT